MSTISRVLSLLFSNAQTHSGGQKFYAEIHCFDLKDFQQWSDMHLYLDLGELLPSDVAMWIDAVSVVGIDRLAMDEEWGMCKLGYSVVGILALGVRANAVL